MCQTLSKAFEMSRKTPLTSTAGYLSKAVCISCIFDSSCAIYQSLGRKSDLEGVGSLLLLRGHYR